MAEFVLDSNAATANSSTATWANTAGGTGTPGSGDSVAIGPRGNSGTGITAASASSGATSVTLSGTSIDLVAGAVIKIAGTTGVYVIRAARVGNGAVTVSPALRGAVAASSAVTYYNGVDELTHDIASATWGDDTTGITTTANGGGSIMVSTGMKWSRSVGTTLTLRGSLWVAPTGWLDMGTSGDRITAVSHTIIPNNSASLSAGKHWIQFGTSTSSWRTGDGSTKAWTAYGIQRTRATRLTAALTAGATSATVADATGWAIGDVVRFGNTDNNGQGSGAHAGVEERTLTSVSGTTVGWTGGLTYAHSDQGYAYNITSNLVVACAGASSRTIIVAECNAGSTVDDFIDLENVRFDYLGASIAATNNYTQGISINLSGSPSSNRAYRVSSCVFNLSREHQITHMGVPGKPGLIEKCIFSGDTSTVAGFGFAGRNGGLSLLEDCHFYLGDGSAVTAAFGFGDGGSTFNRCVFNGISNDQNAVHGVNGSNLAFNDCFFGSCQRYFQTLVAVLIDFNGCAFGTPHPTVGGGTADAANANDFDFGTFAARPQVTLTNCLFNTEPAMNQQTFLGAPGQSFLRIVNYNADTTQQIQFDRDGRTYADAITYRHGTRSIRYEPQVADSAYGQTYVLPGAQAGVPIIIKGALRFDTAYGTATPPSITLSGQGITPQVFTAPATADAWHDFLLTATPVTTGDMTLTVTGQSTATTGQYWLDGLAIGPWVTLTRHFGCLFNNAVFCTVDPDTAETDAAVVAAYTGISINHGTQTLTITDDCTWQQVHDFAMLDLTSAANLTVADWFTGTLGVWTCAYNLVIDGATVTGTSGTLTVTTGKTATMINGASLVDTQIISATSGDTGLLTITGLNSSASVAVYDNSGTQVDYVASAGSTYSLFLTLPNTGTWKYVIHRPGYEAQIGTFNANSLTTVAAVFTLITNADGSTAYTGSSSSVLAVSFTGTTQGNLDIGNGTVTPQQAFDEVEVALSTSAGMAWLAAGKTRVSQFNSAGGDYLFLSTGWRLRRASAGDVNATLNAFAVSADGTPIDGANGSVAYLTSDSPTAIAAAVLAAALAAPIYADIRRVRGQVVNGSGIEADPWGP